MSGLPRDVRGRPAAPAMTASMRDDEEQRLNGVGDSGDGAGVEAGAQAGAGAGAQAAPLPAPAARPAHKRVGTGTKLVLGVGLTLLLAGVGTCSAGVIWLQTNREALTETAKTAIRDGARFGDGTDAAGCLATALQQLDGADGLVAESANKVWLEACLRSATVPAAFCSDIPPRNEIMASATWAIALCDQQGRAGSQTCARLVGAVQERCLAGG